VTLVVVTPRASFPAPPVGFALLCREAVCPSGLKLMDIYRGVITVVSVQAPMLLSVSFVPRPTTGVCAAAW